MQAAPRRDLGAPVIHPLCAKVRETQKRSTIRQPRQGYDMLLAALP